MKKLTHKYSFGFSVTGFAAFAAIMIPNIIWMIHPPKIDPIASNSSTIPAVDISMSAAQWIMTALLILLKSKDEAPNKSAKVCALVCASCIVMYYVSWVCYYFGISNLAMLIGMAIEPSLFFISLAVMLRNYPALPPALIFSVLHIYVTTLNFD